VVQRVTRASVLVDGEVVGAVGGPGGERPGVGEAADGHLLVLLGVTHDDTVQKADALARKVHGLRILRDERSVADTGGGVLVVSQFTLYGDARKGRRPTWTAAAPGAVAEPLYDEFCAALRALGVPVETGRFGADMLVDSVNDGPTTLLLEL
jgi:D-tyrosyl-tRNA(Tyr) deacylase